MAPFPTNLAEATTTVSGGTFVVEDLQQLALNAAAERAVKRRAEAEQAQKQAAAAVAAAAEEEDREEEGVAALLARPKKAEDEHVEAAAAVGMGAAVFEGIAEAIRRQAEADAEIYNSFVAALKEEHRQELQDMRAEALRQADLVSKLETQLQRQLALFEAAKSRLLEQQSLLKEKVQKAEEKAANTEVEALLTKADIEAALVKEQREWLRQAAEINVQVEALREAFFSKSEAARVSHSAHKLAMSAFSLERALAEGAPLGEPVELLRATAGRGEDDLVTAVLDTLPNEALKEGTLTRLQLQQRLASVERDIRTLALIPEDGGGVLTHAMASLSALLKFKEGTHSSTHGHGVEAALAQVEALLAEGRLEDAAKELEESLLRTRAQAVAQEWSKAAKVRAEAELALVALHAHATCKAASLA